MTNNADRAAVARWLGWEYRTNYDAVVARGDERPITWFSGRNAVTHIYNDDDKFLAAIKAKLRELKIEYSVGWAFNELHDFWINSEMPPNWTSHQADTELAAALAAVCAMNERKE